MRNWRFSAVHSSSWYEGRLKFQGRTPNYAETNSALNLIRGASLNSRESDPLPQSVQNSRGCNAAAEAFDEQRRN